MSTRATPRPLLHRLSAVHGEHRLVRVLAVALRASAAVTAVAATVVVLGLVLPISPATATFRGILLGLAVIAAAIWAIRHVRRTSVAFDGFLEQVELAFPALRSWLRNALDFESEPPAGTSAELAGALRDEAARRFDGTAIGTLRPKLAPRVPAIVAGAALAVVFTALAIAPAGTLLSWRTLWQPALAAPPVRIAVEPGSVRVTPGASLVVRARIWGTNRAPRFVRDRKTTAIAAESEGSGPDGARIWRFELAQLTSPMRYAVSAASSRSAEYAISLAGDPQPVGFEIEVRSPAYARLPAQRGAATRGDLEALKGARAEVEVTFDRDLESLDARIVNGEKVAFHEVTPRRWRGEVPVHGTGEYELAATASSGSSRSRYAIHTIDDAPPIVTVRVPEHDVDLPTGQQIPLEVLGQDDLGLTELRLQFRKDADHPWKDQGLARFPGEPREGQVVSHWDASALGLLPGETASFRFALYDNNAVSGRGVGYSPVFELKFPSLSEMYKDLDQTQAGAQQTLEKMADQARDLQKTLERMERQAPRQQPSNSTSNPSFERAQEMKSALERQQQISDQVNQAIGDLKQSLEKGAERDAFRDELQRKMREMSELMKQIQSPEFKNAMKKMQEALEKMDRRAMEQQLPDWREQNKEMLSNLERTIELLKNLRQEEQIDALAKRADDLAKRQDALNQEHAAPQDKDAQKAGAERKDLSERQQKAADQTQELAKDTQDLGKQLDQPEEQQQASDAAQEMSENAEPQQEEAAKSQSSGQQQQASQSGQKASTSLRKAAQQMQQMAQKRQQQRESVDLAAVRRAAQDLLALQRATESNLNSNDPIAQRADRQSDLADGTSRVADSLANLSQRTPFISHQLQQALGRAIDNLGQSGRDMDGGNRQSGEEAGVKGSVALNEAVLELRKTEQSMCNKPGPMQGNQNSMPQRVGQMGEQQSKLNQQTQSVARRLSQQMETTLGDRQELERIGREQQRIRQQLEQIQQEQQQQQQDPHDQQPKLLGRLDRAQEEMKEVEEQLKRGDTGGDLEEKQARILSRLLDAQRSVNRRDFDPERESRPGVDVARPSPPQLPAEAMRENDRLRLDLLKAEADRYPAQYRALIESYLRTLNGHRQ